MLGSFAWFFLSLSKNGIIESGALGERAEAFIESKTGGETAVQMLESGKEVISADRLQKILDSRTESKSLPADASILVGFFDRPEKFLLKGRRVINYGYQEYDAYFETGDYYLAGLEKDFCSTIQKIRQNQDYRVRAQKSPAKILLKYGSLIKLKTACGL